MPTAAELGAEPSGNAYLAQVNAEAHADAVLASHNQDSASHGDIRSAVAAKQDKITGTAGQFVGFSANGDPVATALPKTELPDASTTVKGVTMLSDAVNSTASDRAATPKAVKQAYDLANGKQDPITGTKGQIIGFDANGKPVAQAAPASGVTSFKGRSGAVTPAGGDYTAEMVGALPLSGGTLTGDVAGTEFATGAHENGTIEILPGQSADYSVDHTAKLTDGKLHVGLAGTITVTPSSGSASTSNLAGDFTLGASPAGWPQLTIGTNLNGEGAVDTSVQAQYSFSPAGDLQVTYTEALTNQKKIKVFGEKFIPYQTDGGVWVYDDFRDASGNSVHIYDIYFKVKTQTLDAGGHWIDTVCACKRLTGTGSQSLTTDGVSGQFDSTVSFVAQANTNYSVGLFAKISQTDTSGCPFYQHSLSIVGAPASSGQPLLVSMTNTLGSFAVISFSTASATVYSLASVMANGLISRYLTTGIGEPLS